MLTALVRAAGPSAVSMARRSLLLIARVFRSLKTRVVCRPRSVSHPGNSGKRCGPLLGRDRLPAALQPPAQPVELIRGTDQAHTDRPWSIGGAEIGGTVVRDAQPRVDISGPAP